MSGSAVAKNVIPDVISNALIGNTLESVKHISVTRLPCLVRVRKSNVKAKIGHSTVPSTDAYYSHREHIKKFFDWGCSRKNDFEIIPHYKQYSIISGATPIGSTVVHPIELWHNFFRLTYAE